MCLCLKHCVCLIIIISNNGSGGGGRGSFSLAWHSSCGRTFWAGRAFWADLFPRLSPQILLILSRTGIGGDCLQLILSTSPSVLRMPLMPHAQAHGVPFLTVHAFATAMLCVQHATSCACCWHFLSLKRVLCWYAALSSPPL